MCVSRCSKNNFRGVKKSEGKIHLYDLKNDPLEEHNLATENLDIVTKMEKILTEIRKDSKWLYKQNYENKEDDSEFSSDEDPDLEAELKKMGYI